MRSFVQVSILGVVAGGVYALLAFGIVLIHRVSGVLNFAHATLAMTCTWCFFYLSDQDSGLGIPTPAGLLGTVALGFVFGYVLNRVLFVRMANEAVTKVLATLWVAGLLAQALFPVVQGVVPAQLATTLPPVNVKIAGAGVALQQLAVVVLAVAVALVAHLVLKKTMAGVATRASAQNAPVAELMGVDTLKVTSIAWGVAVASAAAAGALVVPFTYLDLGSLADSLLRAIAASLLAGLVDLRLAVGAALFIGWAEAQLLALGPPFSGAASLIVSVIVLAVLLVGPDRFVLSRYEKLGPA